MTQPDLILGHSRNPNQKLLEQYQTPLWAAEGLAELFFNEIEKRSFPGRLAEPSCGEGRFLEVLPKEQDAYGIEIDPALAAIARRKTGREIFCEDFLLSKTPLLPTHRPAHLLGNPPFKIETVRGFLSRAHEILPEGGCCGLLLPAHSFQHTHTMLDWSRFWRIRPWLLPRDIFTGLSVPILFAFFQKEQGEQGLEGFALYAAAHRIKNLPKILKNALQCSEGEPPGPKTTWKTVVAQALHNLGGSAPLPEIYKGVEPMRPTDNPHWKEKIRQILQMHFSRNGDCWAAA